MRHFVFKSPSVLNVNTESPGCDCSEGLRCVGDNIVNREDHLAALCGARVHLCSLDWWGHGAVYRVYRVYKVYKNSD